MECGAPGVKHFLPSTDAFVGSGPFQQWGNGVFEARTIGLVPRDFRSAGFSPLIRGFARKCLRLLRMP